MPGKRLPDDFLKEIADLYNEYALRPGRFQPNVLIAKKKKVSSATASGWVKAARDRGLLGKTRPNRVCAACQSPLGDREQVLTHYHRASTSRILENARRMQKRLNALAKEAGEQELYKTAAAFLACSANYTLTIASLESAERQLKTLVMPQRLGEKKSHRTKHEVRRREEERIDRENQALEDAEMVAMICSQLAAL